jgi:alpha-glucosidase
LPNNWDDVKFIEGYPGKYVVIARRSGDRWYVAGINAEANEKAISLDLSKFKKKKGIFITDGAEQNDFISEKWKMKNVSNKKITMKPSGGFVLVLE